MAITGEFSSDDHPLFAGTPGGPGTHRNSMICRVVSALTSLGAGLLWIPGWLLKTATIQG